MDLWRLKQFQRKAMERATEKKRIKDTFVKTGQAKIMIDKLNEKRRESTSKTDIPF